MASENWYRHAGEDLLLNVHLQPRASQDEVTGLHNGCLNIRLKAPPVDGRANRRLQEYLAKRLGVPRSRIAIVRGEHSRYKTLSLSGVSGKALQALLG